MAVVERAKVLAPSESLLRMPLTVPLGDHETSTLLHDAFVAVTGIYSS